MGIIKRIKVPTGDICIVEGSRHSKGNTKKNMLEFLSIGDYGKEKNIKADFMGLAAEINGVPHGDLLPLEKKWVITISTQYGSSMGCNFCDVPKVGSGVNATFNDLTGQILEGIRLHPEVTYTERLNVHFARMGEPTWNPHVLDSAKWLKEHIDPEYRVHPVVSTMMPKRNEWLKTFIHTWMRIKNRLYQGNAGLQLSINSTSEDERRIMFNNNACSLIQIHDIMQGIIPSGRKITLNFALAGYEIDAEYLAELFPPEHYICKITPMHETIACKDNNLHTAEGYVKFKPYKQVEENLKNAGYDVIVFVPSKEEDKSKITCGNAIISGI